MPSRVRLRRVDDNQPEVVSAFRKLGWSVLILSEIGRGFPHLAVGKFLNTYLVEIKDGCKQPSKRKFTDDEAQLWREWRGSVILIEGVAEVIGFNRKKTI